MHVVQTDGEPPSDGSTSLANIGWTTKRRNGHVVVRQHDGVALRLQRLDFRQQRLDGGNLDVRQDACQVSHGTHSIYALSEYYRSIQPGAHHLFAKPEKLGGTAPCGPFERAGGFEESAVLDQAPEVLLVQLRAGERLDRPLQL